LEKIEGKIKVENMKKIDIVKMLKSRNYDPDPVNRWKQQISRDMAYEGDDLNVPTEEDTNPDDKKDYDYLLSMPIWNLTMEKKDNILKDQKAKGDELKLLKSKTPNMLWLEDLNQFLIELTKYEEKEKEDESASQFKAYKASITQKGADGKKKAATYNAKTTKLEYLPSPDGEFIEPVVDSALIKEAQKNKDVVKREPEVKTELSLIDVITLNTEEARKLTDQQVAEFAANLSKPKKKSPIKKEKVVKEKAEKPTKIKTEKDEEDKASKKSSNKKSENTLKNYFNKKSKTSDDESDNSVIASEPEIDDSFAVEKRIISRARKEVKYATSDNELNNSSKENSSDEEEVSKKRSKSKKMIDDTFDDEDIEEIDLSDEETFKASKPKKSKKEESEKNSEVKPAKSIFKSKENIKPEKTIKEDKPALKKQNSKASVKQTETKPKKAPAVKNKKTIETSDEEVQVLTDSDDSDYEQSKPKTKRKLMDKPEPFDLFKKVATAANKKKAKNVIDSDDDLYAS
jgi:DNA topoisomerase-2